MNSSSKVKILIVEDEILLAKDIAHRLTAMHYHVAGIASSADKALEILNQVNDIDIILMDIVIKGEIDGIDLAAIVNSKFDIPIIFLTSHADRSVIDRAKKVRFYAYILKPFNDRQVSIAIELALVNFSNNTPKQELLNTQELPKTENTSLQIKDSLFLKKEHHFERVSLKDILFLEADSNYCTVHTKSKKFIYSLVLKKIEAQLPKTQFLRIHRSYVVNIEAVNGFEGNMLFIGERKLPVSKTYRAMVFKSFQTI